MVCLPAQRAKAGASSTHSKWRQANTEKVSGDRVARWLEGLFVTCSCPVHVLFLRRFRPLFEAEQDAGRVGHDHPATVLLLSFRARARARAAARSHHGRGTISMTGWSEAPEGAVSGRRLLPAATGEREKAAWATRNGSLPGRPVPALFPPCSRPVPRRVWLLLRLQEPTMRNWRALGAAERTRRWERAAHLFPHPALWRMGAELEGAGPTATERAPLWSWRRGDSEPHRRGALLPEAGPRVLRSFSTAAAIPPSHGPGGISVAWVAYCE
jgi:hypothetical protein